MRATEQEQTAGAGTYEAMAKFQRIGWAPHRTDALHDHGTDLIVTATSVLLHTLGGDAYEEALATHRRLECDAFSSSRRRGRHTRIGGCGK